MGSNSMRHEDVIDMWQTSIALLPWRGSVRDLATDIAGALDVEQRQKLIDALRDLEARDAG